MRTCPCKDCESREVGCHGRCDKYKAWSDKNVEEREMIHNKKMLERIGRNSRRKSRK